MTRLLLRPRLPLVNARTATTVRRASARMVPARATARRSARPAINVSTVCARKEVRRVRHLPSSVRQTTTAQRASSASTTNANRASARALNAPTAARTIARASARAARMFRGCRASAASPPSTVSQTATARRDKAASTANVPAEEGLHPRRHRREINVPATNARRAATRTARASAKRVSRSRVCPAFSV